MIEFKQESMTDMSVMRNGYRIGYIFLDDPIKFDTFEINELEQILTKMKELQGENKS